MAEVWSDLHHEIRHDSKGAVKKVVNTAAVESSIHNILGTRILERVMIPEFASELDSILFEPMTEAISESLAVSVKRVIERWDDRVSIVSIDSSQKPDSNKIDLVIEYRIRGYTGTYTTSTSIGG